MAIKITIEQTGREIYTVEENVVTEETPISVADSSYGSKEVKYAKKFQVLPVQKVNNWTRELLKQSIEDETKFDLAAVIRAINSL